MSGSSLTRTALLLASLSLAGSAALAAPASPFVAMAGSWSGSGVLIPEQLDPDPYLALLDRYGIHHAVAEMVPGAHRPT